MSEVDTKVKIFVMNTVIPSGIDGSMVHRWELVQNLAALGHEIHTISNEEYGNAEYNGIHFYVEPEIETQRVFGGLLHRFMYAIFLINLIRAHDFDVLYTRTPALMSGIIGYLSKKIMGLPLVFEINGIAFEEQELMRSELLTTKRSLFVNIKIEFRKRKEIFMWNKADALIAVTDGIKRYLVRHGVGENKIWVIGNGANTDLFRPMDQNIIRSELGLDPVSTYVCFVGNLAPWQGVEYFIHAAPLVLERDSEVKFLIVGDGAIRDKLEKMVSNLGLNENFIFTGTVPYEDVPKYINAGDICVVPKLKVFGYGYSPLKLYEYMACGKPVIATNTKGFEILELYNAGLLVNPEVAQELSEAIVKLQEGELRKRMGENGRVAIIEEYSWEKVAERVASVCENTIKKISGL